MRVFKPIGSILIWLYGLHLRYWVTALLKISIGKIPVGFQNVLSFRYFDKTALFHDMIRMFRRIINNL